MVEIRRTPIDHPSAWRSSDFASRNDFAIDLGPRHLRAFECALERIRAEGLGLDDIERSHFEVPEIAGDIAAWFDEIQHGRGFVYLRGFPVDRYSEEEIGIIYWGIGTHMGVGVSQSVLGDRLGHVMDFSKPTIPTPAHIATGRSWISTPTSRRSWRCSACRRRRSGA